jgi:hypothetical protein
MSMDEACNEKRSIYVELVLALLAEGWAVKLCTDVADYSSWYGKYSTFEDSEDTTEPTFATGPAVDETAHDNSDVESSSSDDDQPDDTAPAPQPPPKKARSKRPEPLRVIPMEEGEVRYPIRPHHHRRPRWLPARVQQGRAPRARNPADQA